MSESIKIYDLSSIKYHVRSKLTTASSVTSTYLHYCAQCHNVLINVSANYDNASIILNRGLIVRIDNTDLLSLRDKCDTALLSSVDNKQMIINLSFSQK